MSFNKFPSTSDLELVSINATITSDENNFSQLETEYTKMIGIMEADPKLAKYIDAHSKLFDFLYSEHVRCTALANAKEEMETRLEETTLQLEESVNTITNNAQLIVTMKKDIDDSHKNIDQVHSREQSSQEIIDNLRRNIQNIQKEIAFKQRMTFVDPDETTVVKHKQGIVRENIELAKEVAKLSEGLQDALNYQEQLELRTDLAEMKILDICNLLENVTEELDVAKHNRMKLEMVLEHKRMQFEDLREEEEYMQLINQEELNLIHHLQDEMKRLCDRTDKCIAKHEACVVKTSRLQQNFNKMAERAKFLEVEQDLNVGATKMELREHVKIREMLEACIHQKAIDNGYVEQLLANEAICRKETDKVRDEIAKLEVVLFDQKFEVDNGKRQLINHNREKDVIRKKIALVTKMGSLLLSTIDFHESERFKREMEVEFHEQEIQKQIKHFSYLEKERDRYTDENLENAEKIQNALQDLRFRKIQIFEQKKTQVQHRNKMRQLINLYDETRSHAAMLRKSLKINNIVANDLHLAIQKYYWLNKMVLSHIVDKEHLAEQSKLETQKLGEERDSIRSTLGKTLGDIRTLKVELVEKTLDVKALHVHILGQDRLLRYKTSEIEALTHEREILGQQIDRRNQELYFLYQKIAILWTASQSGEDSYALRLDDIHLLKLEITRLRQVKQALTDDVNNMNDLKIEVFHLEVDLRRERLKSKVLEEELGGTTNIHRWRKLEASNPEVYNLLRYIVLIQKRVLSNNKLLENGAMQTRQVKKVTNSMQNILSKLPGLQFQAKAKRANQTLRVLKQQEKNLLIEMQNKEIENIRVNIELQQGTSNIKQERLRLANARKTRRKDLKRLNELKQNIRGAGNDTKRFAFNLEKTHRTKFPLI